MSDEPKIMEFENENTEAGGLVYFVSDGTAIKIGHTTGKVTERISALQTGNPRLITVVRTIPGTQELERSYHERFAARLVRPNSEWFALQTWEIWGLDQPGFVRVGGAVKMSGGAAPAVVKRISTWLRDCWDLFPTKHSALDDRTQSLVCDPELDRPRLWSDWESWRKHAKCKPVSLPEFERVLDSILSERGAEILCRRGIIEQWERQILKGIEGAVWNGEGGIAVAPGKILLLGDRLKPSVDLSFDAPRDLGEVSFHVELKIGKRAIHIQECEALDEETATLHSASRKRTLVFKRGGEVEEIAREVIDTELLRWDASALHEEEWSQFVVDKMAAAGIGREDALAWLTRHELSISLNRSDRVRRGSGYLEKFRAMEKRRRAAEPANEEPLWRTLKLPGGNTPETD
jgi:hypothetical protein